ncbi:MAG: DUF1285 domain-containing protein [Syntrophobacterales bacterium]|nr:DUF1285 domain-containing protein [Syntrophobacterales bacterium]
MSKSDLIPRHQKHVYHYFIDGNGNWFCEGNRVTDRELLKILSSSIFEMEGRYYIRCEGEIHPVEVQDAPLWVKYVHINPGLEEGDIESIEIELTDGRKELLRPETLWIEGETGIYCLASRKNLRARFGKIAYYELAKYILWKEDLQAYTISIKRKDIIIPQKRKDHA